MTTATTPGVNFLAPRWWVLSLGWWSLFGVVSAAQIYVREVPDGGAPWSVVANIVYFYWAWALVTPPILAIAPRVLGPGRGWPARTGEQVVVLVLALGTQALLYTLFGIAHGRVDPATLGPAALASVQRHLAGNLLTYAAIVGSFAVVELQRRSRARARALEAGLAAARLEALRARLQPHFLFNTLNVISTLVLRGDAEGATTAIARLGDLLRATLDEEGRTEVTVAEELALARQYLAIAQLRLGDRLRITEAIDDGALGATVPALLLQPVIENAIQHGIAARPEGGQLGIEARREGTRVVLRVSNDGPSFPPGGPGEGVGLAAVRAQLALRYGPGATLETRNRDGGGVVVTVTIPAAAGEGA